MIEKIEINDKVRILNRENNNNRLLNVNDKLNAAYNSSFNKISVCVRKKPIGEGKDTIKIENNNVIVQNNKLSYSLDDIECNKTFIFDKAFDEYASNDNIFDFNIKDLVDYSINGKSGSIIAYGQTGTGKTYTLLEQDSGLLFQILKYSLTKISRGSLSFLEVYMGNIQDCLRENTKISLFEKNNEIYASDIAVKSFNSFEEAKEILKTGISNRTTTVTASNESSSRSHAVIIVEFTQSIEKSEIVRSKKLLSDYSLAIVDLAGSEKGSDRKECSKEVAIEGAEINRSLLALKECIRGIEMKNKFLPFRQSKLTQILKNSLIGNSKTCFIANISASVKDIEHTLNTLRYASRIKESSTKRNDNSSFILNEDEIFVKNLENNNKELDINKTNDESIIQIKEIANIFDSKCNIVERSSIQPSTIVFQRSKIEKTLKKINNLVDKENNLQKLKNIMSELEGIISKLSNK